MMTEDLEVQKFLHVTCDWTTNAILYGERATGTSTRQLYRPRH